MSELPQWLADHSWRPGRGDVPVSAGTIYRWIRRREFPPANIRRGARRVEWSEEFLLAYREHKRRAGSRLNAAEFAENHKQFWQGDTEEIARQVKKRV